MNGHFFTDPLDNIRGTLVGVIHLVVAANLCIGSVVGSSRCAGSIALCGSLLVVGVLLPGAADGTGVYYSSGGLSVLLRLLLLHEAFDASLGAFLSFGLGGFLLV